MYQFYDDMVAIIVFCFPLCIANCGNPTINRNITVVGLVENDRAVVQAGTTVAISCPDGLTPIGPNASTCMENGEWEPDLREVKCKGESAG